MNRNQIIFIVLCIAVTSGTVFSAGDRVANDLTIPVTLIVNKTVNTVNNGTTNVFVNNNTGWTTGTSTVFNNTNGVTIGIGTSSPLEKLDVRGNINVSGNVNATLIYLMSLISCTNRLGTTSTGQIFCNTTSLGGSGTVTSVGGTHPIIGLITSSGNLSFDNTSYSNAEQRLINLFNNVSQLSGNVSTLDTREAANNVSNTALANTKALPGNCPFGSVVQNSTTGGVQCIGVGFGNGTGSGSGGFSANQTVNTSSQVNFTGGIITTTLNASVLVNTSFYYGNLSTATFPFSRCAINQAVLGIGSNGTVDCEDEVQSIGGIPGVVALVGDTKYINVTNSTILSTITVSAGSLMCKLDQVNLFTANQTFQQGINVSGLVNTTLLQVRNGATFTNGGITLSSSSITLGTVGTGILLGSASLIFGSTELRVQGYNLNVTGVVNASSYIGNLSTATFPGSNNTCPTGTFAQNITNLINGVQQVQCAAAAGSGTVTRVGGTHPIIGEVTSSGNLSFDNTSYSNVETKLTNLAGNVSQLSTNVSLLNTSTTNLDVREKADNDTQARQLERRIYTFYMGTPGGVGFSYAANTTQYHNPLFTANAPTATQGLYFMNVTYNATIDSMQVQSLVAGNLGGCNVAGVNNINCTFNITIQINKATNYTVIRGINTSQIFVDYMNLSVDINVNRGDILEIVSRTPAWSRLPTIAFLGGIVYMKQRDP